MRHAGQMKWRVTPYTVTQSKSSSGSVAQTETAGTTVWGALSRPTERRQVGAGRYEFPATAYLRVDDASWAVAGNQVEVTGPGYSAVRFEILGREPHEVDLLALKEVTR